ncbi:NYN domain-containing protein [Mariniflexile sp. HMF6888]|uniref:NYN domain-containing protein n=1 Tax=Mariniflexile sp. HMF6888 TaxID=3373086 RepID=UPI0037B10E19
MKVSFLIDGFNLYHSIEDLYTEHRIKAKWLDVKTLLRTYLTDPNFKELSEERHSFNGIYYFTALRYHVAEEKPQSIARHERYINAIKSTGIEIIYGGFKPKTIKCKECGRDFIKHEEKKTDVAIATKLLELVHKSHSEVYVIVSGDTDLIPAIETARIIDSSIKIILVFPYGRTNDELKNYADLYYTIKPKRYKSCQFDGIINIGDKKFAKPGNW